MTVRRRAFTGALLLAAACLDAPPSSINADAAPPPPSLCGTTRALRDDFSAVSGLWDLYGSGELAGDRQQLYAGPEETTGITSRWLYRIAGGELAMQTRSVYLEPGSEMRMKLVDRADDSVGLILTDEVLSLVVEVGGSRTIPAAVDFDSEMTWWKLAEADGVFTFSTSGNGESWTDHGEADNPLSDLAEVLVEISAPAAQQAMIEIEAVNPMVGEGLCPIESIAEAFETLSPRWAELIPAGCELTTDGVLSISLDGVAECGIESLEQFDLRNGVAAIEVVATDDCNPSAHFTVELAGLSAEFMCFNEGVPHLFGLVHIAGEEVDEIGFAEYQSDAHRLWRFRHETGANLLHLETASAAGDWQTFATAPISEDALSAAGLSMHVEDELVDGDLAPVVFDRLNLVP